MWQISGFKFQNQLLYETENASIRLTQMRNVFEKNTVIWRLLDVYVTLPFFALAENSFDFWLVRDLLKWWRGLARGTWRRWRRSLHLGLASVVRPSSDFSSSPIGASSSLTSHSTVANSQARRRNEVLVYLNWTLIYYVHYLVYHHYYYKI